MTDFLLKTLIFSLLVTDLTLADNSSSALRGRFASEETFDQYMARMVAQDAIEAAATEVDPCSLPASERKPSIQEFCFRLTEDSNPLFTYCKAIIETNAIFGFNLKGAKNTLFAPNREAWIKYYKDNINTDAIENGELKKALEYQVIPNKLMGSADIWCKKRYATKDDRKGVRIVCKLDIAGNPVVFVRGSDKKSQKKFTPFVENPKEPIELCNANIFIVDNFILKKKNSQNQNKDNAMEPVTEYEPRTAKIVTESEPVTEALVTESNLVTELDPTV